jgi:hypothetical protein
MNDGTGPDISNIPGRRHVMYMNTVLTAVRSTLHTEEGVVGIMLVTPKPAFFHYLNSRSVSP